MPDHAEAADTGSFHKDDSAQRRRTLPPLTGRWTRRVLRKTRSKGCCPPQTGRDKFTIPCNDSTACLTYHNWWGSFGGWSWSTANGQLHVICHQGARANAARLQLLCHLFEATLRIQIRWAKSDDKQSCPALANPPVSWSRTM